MMNMLPRVDVAPLESGSIGWSMAELLARHATPQTEAALLQVARGKSVQAIRIALSPQKSPDSPAPPDDDELARTLSLTLPLEEAWALAEASNQPVQISGTPEHEGPNQAVQISGSPLLAFTPDTQNQRIRRRANDFASCYPRLAMSIENDGSAFEYDANPAPHPERWLAFDEGERLAAIDAFHHELNRSTGRRASLHNGIHCIVENQIALSDPPATAETLERLMRDGLSRHDAIHKIGTLVAELLTDAAGAYDEEAYVRKLQRLTADQ